MRDSRQIISSKLVDPIECGLSSLEALKRLTKYGPNEPVTVRRGAALIQLLLLFANPLVIILLIASSISFAVGNRLNALIIILMVLLSVALNFVQTWRSQKAAESLRIGVSPTATVMRDGSWKEILRRGVVPGDLVRLSAGDLIPADARLIVSKNLYVQESALTGESLPVEKDPTDSNNERGRVFLGTSVVSGEATATVIATGPSTDFGKIAERLSAKRPETDFERGTRKFGFLIARVTILMVIFVLVVSLAMHRDLFESLLFSIALAVGLTPEFLPMITTVTLGQGALRMAHHKVIVKHLSAIQNLGSIDILCCDKTGTLTKGELVLKNHVDPFGNPSERTFLLAYLSSYFETGINNPIDRAIRKKGDPIDEAIVEHERPDITTYSKIDEIPFDFERKRMSIVVESGAERSLITKGAPENVMAICSAYDTGSTSSELDAGAKTKCELIYKDYCRRGLRVIAVAHKKVPVQDSYGFAEEQNLVLAGFLAIADEPLESAAQAIRMMAKDGVSVKCLTGDNELVARSVCEEVGLDCEKILLGTDIDRINDIALGQVAEETNVFARVTPMHKTRILLALKSRGHVVGFLGDGINDAPSIRAADVGISVAGATDVAKDAAEVVLLEKGLSVLHQGIIEGRRSFGNVMKYLLMGTSSNFGNMFSMAGAVIFLPFLPMLPTQILLNNFLYDLAQITIPTDKVDETFIRKPHHWDVKLIRNFMLYLGPISSAFDFLTFYVLLHIFNATESFFQTGWFIESLASQTLVIFIIRTAGNPFRSKPSKALTGTVCGVVLLGIALPFSPVSNALGFTPLPLSYFGFLILATGSYLLIVELVKRRLMFRLN